jgi:hypothetical protein
MRVQAYRLATPTVGGRGTSFLIVFMDVYIDLGPRSQYTPGHG